MPQDLIVQLQHASLGARIAVGGIALVGLIAGFHGLRRYRLIEDVPTARIRSAPQGYVELVGTADLLPGPPIVSPLTQTTCCWYSYKVERRRERHWQVVQRGTSDELFLLRDDTGECVVDPEGASVQSLHRQRWSGSGTGQPAMYRVDQRLGAMARGLGRVLEGLDVVGDHRYEETVILPGDPLYVIGWFESLDDSDWAESERARAAELLREWKRQPETLRERFDHDRNGIIDQDEWEDARRAARRRAREELAEARARTHVHLIRRPEGRQFILSNRPEADLVRHFRWQAGLGFAAFFVGLGLLAAMFSGPA